MAQKTDNGLHKGLVAAFILSFALILLICLFLISYNRQVTLTLESGEKHFKAITSAATQVSSFAKRAEGHMMLYLVFHREADQKKLPTRLASLDNEIAILDQLVKEENARILTENIKATAKKIPSIIPPLMAIHNKEFETTGHFDATKHQKAILAAHTIFSELRGLGVELSELELELESQGKRQVLLAADKLRISLYFATIGIIIFILFVGIILIRNNLNLNREISYRKKAELYLKRSYETQAAINKLLKDSLGEETIIELLQGYLNLVISLPWLTFETMGSIFLIEKEPDVLVMKVQHGFSEALKKRCTSVPFGECLCGRAAMTEKLVFSNHIDEYHTYNFTGIEDHGHYCVPISSKNKLFGILNIYVKPGHERKEFEETFLMTIANTLAGVLVQKYAENEKIKMEAQLRQSQKLESIGQLAAGISHEINTPIQYIGDNTTFLKDAFQNMIAVFKAYKHLLKTAKTGRIDSEIISQVETAIEDADLEFLKEEVPIAIDQSISGLTQVSKIVTSMKEFSHLEGEQQILTDINHALDNTITVTKNNWKNEAELTTDFDNSLPKVMCNPGELNQVFLNLIINASHSIAKVRGEQPDKKGTIIIRTQNKGEWARITIKDSGSGIPKEIHDKIFDPFFTTKDVGKGTGQGLAVSHSIIVERHKGNIFFETEKEKGTTFIIELPISGYKEETER